MNAAAERPGAARVVGAGLAAFAGAEHPLRALARSMAREHGPFDEPW